MFCLTLDILVGAPKTIHCGMWSLWSLCEACGFKPIAHLFQSRNLLRLLVTTRKLWNGFCASPMR